MLIRLSDDGTTFIGTPGFSQYNELLKLKIVDITWLQPQIVRLQYLSHFSNWYSLHSLMVLRTQIIISCDCNLHVSLWDCCTCVNKTSAKWTRDICHVCQGVWKLEVYPWAINQSAQQLSDFLRCLIATLPVSGRVNQTPHFTNEGEGEVGECPGWVVRLSLVMLVLSSSSLVTFVV